MIHHCSQTIGLVLSVIDAAHLQYHTIKHFNNFIIQIIQLFLLEE